MCDFYTGTEEHGALCRPEQSHKASACVSAMDGENHGGVLQAGRQGKGARHGDQSHVRQTHRICGKKSGK